MPIPVEPRAATNGHADADWPHSTETDPSEPQALPYLLLNQLPIGIFQKDREGRYIFVNSSFCKLKELTPEDFLGKTAAEVAANTWRPENSEQPDKLRQINTINEGAKHHKIIVETGQTIETEEYHNSDGKERYFHVLKGPVFGPDGSIVGSQGIVLDVTGRKHAEAQLASERDMLKALMDSSGDAIYFKDRDSRFIRCSTGLASFFGLPKAEDAIGHTDFDFFGEEHAREAFNDEQEIIRTGKAMLGKTERETLRDGRITWALSSKMPLLDDHGQIIGTFGISKDITQIKEAETTVENLHKQLLQTSRQAGMAEVATSVLHNVGNVLNSVNVSASLLLDNTKKSNVAYLIKAVGLLRDHAADLGAYLTDDPKGKQLPGYLARVSEQLAKEQERTISELDSLRENIEHIKEIVAMQQNYARVSGVAETVKVTDLVEDALRMNAGALVRHEVALVRDYGETPPLSVEKHKVLQILVNLIRNAKYACDDSGRHDKQIKLKVCQQDEHICISVIDNGVGIPPENRTRIFNHGFTTRKEGHGFGLHSGALAATELGGTLTVHSDGLGHGATFTLALPLQPPKNN